MTSTARAPNKREIQNNKKRERKRRAVLDRIFTGLRQYGKDNMEVLKALCREEGYTVDEEGNMVKQEGNMVNPSSFKHKEGTNGEADEEGNRVKKEGNMVNPSSFKHKEGTNGEA